MASPYAVSAVSEAIRRLLDDACPRGMDYFPGAVVKVCTASEFEKPPPVGVGLSLYLYRAVVNGPQRNRSGRVTPSGQRMRPSLPLDLYFLLTPWGLTAEAQHRLLGWAMRTLEDSAILPAGLLNAKTRTDIFRPSEAVELVADPISLQDQSSLWQALRSPWQLSAAYIARMVPLDSDVPLTDAGPVVEREYALHARAEA